MRNLELIEKVRQFCKSIFETSRCKKLPFHNWQHTKDVVRNSEFIALHEKLSEATIEELIIASYFHDVGNAKCSVSHEKVSGEYAQAFLQKENYPIDRIGVVINMINATRMPQNPETLLEKVICDADLSHIGKKSFYSKNKKLRKEWSTYDGKTFTDEQWITMNIHFLQNHTFHTSFAKKHYEAQKRENIELLKELITV